MNNSEKLIVTGNRKLLGNVKISGAKNSALPLMTVSLLIDNGFQLKNVPDLLDTKIMRQLISELGVKINIAQNSINFFGKPIEIQASENLVNKMRASILILAPLLQSKKRALVPLPGGCEIGSRPIDMHIEVIKKLGAKVELKDGYLIAELSNKGFIGSEIKFSKVSVGATECAILASVLAKGKTILSNVAMEPEIVDLGNCLNKAGANIKGLGEKQIIITGVKTLNPITYSVMPDRIETGSFALAAAITRGKVFIKDTEINFLKKFLEKLNKAGVKVECFKNELKVTGYNKISSVDISTQPHPGFPTDLQAQFMSFMCLADGKSVIKENIFENRFQHVPELNKMGAKIKISKNKATVIGSNKLFPAIMKATDLRASMSLIIASLAAEGRSEVLEIEHLRRGYENIENKLSDLGADIK